MDLRWVCNALTVVFRRKGEDAGTCGEGEMAVLTEMSVASAARGCRRQPEGWETGGGPLPSLSLQRNQPSDICPPERKRVSFSWAQPPGSRRFVMAGLGSECRVCVGENGIQDSRHPLECFRGTFPKMQGDMWVHQSVPFPLLGRRQQAPPLQR